MKNLFGKRYISDKEFLDYAWDVGLFADHPSRLLLEFLERHGILKPSARIRFPAEIARRWHKDHYPSANVPEPVEPDTPRLRAACILYEQVFDHLWSEPEIFGERIHPVDEMRPEHKPFIETTFDTTTFLPWDDLKVSIALHAGEEIHDGATYIRICYHYWHIFPLASYMRSGLTILYDLGDDALFYDLWKLKIRSESRAKLYPRFNLEARHELKDIMEHSALFDAVAYFEAYRQNAFRRHIHSVDRTTGKLPLHLSRQYRARQRALAEETMVRFDLRPDQLLKFIKFQAELWCEASRRSPPMIADEYRRNIGSTVDLYRLVARKSFDQITADVGRAGGYFKPILKVIFPSWLDEQRGLAERSLRRWMLPSMAASPPPFAVSAQDVAAFCDWLEKEGLFQFYWHFRRLLDIGFTDTPIARTAIASEVVSYANSVELLANAILLSRGKSPRNKTLGEKVPKIVVCSAPKLAEALRGLRELTRTNKSTLKRQLARINRIKEGGPHAPVLRIFLRLIVIRNEGSHLGLRDFDRKAIYALLESLVQASMLLWMAQRKQ